MSDTSHKAEETLEPAVLPCISLALSRLVCFASLDDTATHLFIRNSLVPAVPGYRAANTTRCRLPGLFLFLFRIRRTLECRKGASPYRVDVRHNPQILSRHSRILNIAFRFCDEGPLAKLATLRTALAISRRVMFASHTRQSIAPR